MNTPGRIAKSIEKKPKYPAVQNPANYQQEKNNLRSDNARLRQERPIETDSGTRDEEFTNSTKQKKVAM